MKRILIVKLTSMGDLIQMLPALTDAATAIPGIRFDWVVDESFKDIPPLHPSVENIIVVPYRRFKKNITNGNTFKDMKHCWHQLRQTHYDMVIDTQSNFKSAFITRLTKGTKYGLDGQSVREYGAQWAYNKTITVSRMQNHAKRMRQLLATFLGYREPQTPPDYGIGRENLPNPDIKLPQTFVFITAVTSRKEKLWPEAYWQEVIAELLLRGYELVLPWWGEEEHQRVSRLKNNSPKVHLLPPMTLAEKAAVLSKAMAAISLDTGLAHMAAALDIPNVVLYGPTDPNQIGAYGKNQVHLRAHGAVPLDPTTRRSNQWAKDFQPTSVENIKPREVLQAFYALVD